MKKIIISLMLLIAANPLFAAIITIDFEEDNIADFNLVGDYTRYMPFVPNNGYDVLANFTSSDYVGFSSAAPGDSLDFVVRDSNRFDLLELSLAGAWGAQTATLIGYTGDVQTNSIGVAINRFSATNVSLNWSNLTSFSIVTGNDFVYQPGHSCCGDPSQRQITFDNIVVDVFPFDLGGGGSGGEGGSGGNGGNDGSNGSGGSSGSGGNDVVQVNEPSPFFLLALGLIGLFYSRKTHSA